MVSGTHFSISVRSLVALVSLDWIFFLACTSVSTCSCRSNRSCLPFFCERSVFHSSRCRWVGGHFGGAFLYSSTHACTPLKHTTTVDNMFRSNVRLRASYFHVASISGTHGSCMSLFPSHCSHMIYVRTYVQVTANTVKPL